MAYVYTPCSLISAPIGTTSCIKITGGVLPVFYLANRTDIAGYTPASGNKMLATAITMNTGKTFFPVSGKLQSVEPKVTIKTTKYQNSWIHELKFVIFDLSPASLLQINNLTDGDFAAIVPNNFTGTGGNSKYDMYGFDGGMKVSAASMEKNNADTLGAVEITLTTADYSLEGDFVKRFFSTDAATTETAITALLP